MPITTIPGSMKTITHYLRTILTIAALLAAVAIPGMALAAVPPMSAPAGLSILEIKMTGDEFILLQNSTPNDITNLSSYWLTAYNNVNPLAAGVSSSTQQLPTASLLAGQALLLSADPMQTCGASVAGKLSLSFGDSGGFLQLAQTSLSPSGAIMQTPGDVVSWSSGTTGIIQNLPSNTKDPKAVYYRYLNGGSYAWQQADLDLNNLCQLNVLVAGGSGSSSAVTPLTLAATSPPATILGTVNAGGDDDEIVAQLPAADIGLNAPQLSELLPNPIGTGNDGTDEFIELYNPNAKPFDLTGFSLLSGMTTTHSYTFPNGTMLAPSSFQAFYSEETKLSLSNTASQVALLDPFDNVISSTDAYAKAKDGIAWGLAKGKWYWTTQPTPGVANVIKQPPVSKTASQSKKTSKSKAAAIKGAKTTKLTASATAGNFEEEEAGTPVHAWVLALIASGALLYGAYEYRRDIANRLFQLRTKLGARRATWPALKGRRSD
ncbi:MAG: hypothetical protein JWN82_697 [Candidatus Saccharibacteria bacterium]|nr:hypothetical protein [Candidatus Saccharibacteria bacterium]